MTRARLEPPVTSAESARRGRDARDRFAIAAYLGRNGRLADALVRFASAYADQNERDHAAFAAAVAPRAGPV